MEGDLGYALQKLELAIADLATGPGDVRSRLGGVYLAHLHVLTEADFPPALRPDWKWVMSKLTRMPPLLNDDGDVVSSSVDRTLHRMRNSTGTKIAERLVELRDRLRAHLEDLP